MTKELKKDELQKKDSIKAQQFDNKFKSIDNRSSKDSKLNHTDLIKLGQALDYSTVTDGLCHGFSMMLTFAFLLQDEETFFARLELIHEYRDNFDKLKEEIEQVRNKLKRSGPLALTEKDWKLLEIPAFFEGVSIYLRPFNYRSLFNDNYLIPNNIKSIYPLVHSKALEKQDISIVLDKYAAFDRVSLENWLSDLVKAFEQSSSPVPMVMTHHNHGICFKYDQKNKYWTFADTNNLWRFAEGERYAQKLNTKELADCIFKSFSDDLNGYTIVHAQAIALNPDKSLIAALKQIELNYKLKPEHALLCNKANASLLYLACINGNLELVNYLIQWGADVNQATEDGSFPLHTVCGRGRGHFDLVILLLEAHARVNQTNDKGFTALMTACEEGYYNIIQKLLEFHAEVNLVSNEGYTALYFACQNGYVEVVKTLLNAGADPNLKGKDTMFPIDIARKNGYLNIVQLLEQSQHISPKNTHELTPLHKACDAGQLHDVCVLLDAGAKVNLKESNGYTPLYLACKKGHLPVVRRLLEVAGNIDNSDHEGRTPFLVACKENHLNIVSTLFEFSPENINQADYKNCTPLWYACKNGHSNIVAKLLQHHANIDLASYNNETPLFMACLNGDIEVVNQLLEAGANINKAALHQFTPLYVACQNAHLDIVKKLLEFKANMSQSIVNGYTPLMIALENGHLDVVDFLLKNGVDIHQETCDGMTPLLLACKKGYRHIVMQLLELRADVNHKSDEGLTALNIAQGNKDWDLVEKILESREKNKEEKFPILSKVMCLFPKTDKLSTGTEDSKPMEETKKDKSTRGKRAQDLAPSKPSPKRTKSQGANKNTGNMCFFDNNPLKKKTNSILNEDSEKNTNIGKRKNR